MNEINDITKIRELLVKWYSGAATTAEEATLCEALLSAGDLPADLKEEQPFFRAIAEAASSQPPMPEEYTSRINAAITSEIAKTQEKKGKAGALFTRHLWIRSLSGIAVCLALAFGVREVWNAPDMTAGQPAERVAINIASPVARYDSLPLRSLTLEPREEKGKGKPTTGAASRARKKEARGAINVQPRAARRDIREEDAGYFTAEEERLARSNYRVVTDEEEADELLSSIFSRMENTMAMESSRISKIELEYDSEMTRLRNIDNNEPHREKYNDETPL